MSDARHRCFPGNPAHLAVAAAAVVLLVAPAPALAADWYVETPANGGNGSACTQASPCDKVVEAVAAAADGDTIHIGSGEFDEGVSTSKQLNLVGAGPGTPSSFDPTADTLIVGNSGLLNPRALRLRGGGTVSNLRLKGDDAAGLSPGGEGLLLGTDALAEPPLSYTVSNTVALGGGALAPGVAEEGLRIDDVGSPGRTITASVINSYFSSASTADPVMLVTGQEVSAAFTKATVEPQLDSVAFTATGGAEVTLEQSNILRTVNSRAGVRAMGAGTGLHVMRSTLAAQEEAALWSINGAHVDLTDSVVALLIDPSNPDPNGSSYDSAAIVTSGPGAPTSTLDANGTTFVARGKGVDEAVAAVGTAVGSSGGIATIRNSIMKATDTDGAPGDVDLYANGSVSQGGAGPATATAISSSFTDSKSEDGGTATPPGTGTNVTGDPLFTSEIDGSYDFTLQAGSPAIDRGDPSLVTSGALDLAGNPRSLAFALDCVVVPDMGAYEKVGAPAHCASSDQPPGGERSEPSLLISRRSTRVSRRGAVRIKLICLGSGGDPCAGALTLRSATRIRTTRGSKRRTKVRLGSANFSILQGSSTNLRFKIRRKAFAVLRRLRRLRVTATATLHAPSGATRTTRAKLTLRGPKAAKRRRR